MSPTVFHKQGFRFFFFSREEPRMHVLSGRGEAKFWIEPTIAAAKSHGLSDRELKVIHDLIEEHQDDIVEHWRRHFSSRS